MAKKRLAEKQVMAAIEKTRGNLAAIARAAGVSRQAVQKFVATHPALQEAAEEAREAMLDEAENKLYDEAMSGNTACLIFLLKTQGRQRGYIERVAQEVSGPDGKAIEIKATDYRSAIAPLAPTEAGSMGDSNPSGES